MSTAPAIEPEVLLDANGNPIETWGGKFERKFKENPFVPSVLISAHMWSEVAGLTTASLIVAAAKLKRRDSTSLNHWLRVRVVMQGLTIVAVVGGSWWYGQMKHQKEAAAADEQERILERAAFSARLRAAEEADRMERFEEAQAKQTYKSNSMMDESTSGSSKSGGGWFGWMWKGSSGSSQ